LLFRSSFTDDRDGEVYATIKIGRQTWMAENLRYNAAGSLGDHASHGEVYADVNVGSQTWTADNLRYVAVESQIWMGENLIEYNPDLPAEYGHYYDWATVMNGASSSSSSPSGVQGICPTGWHVPSDAEWTTLELSLGMSASDASLSRGARGSHGTAMKSTSGWVSGNGTNSSGFNAFPAGFFHPTGVFVNSGKVACFWSAQDEPIGTGTDGTFAWSRYLSGGSQVSKSLLEKEFGISCRCVKN